MMSTIQHRHKRRHVDHADHVRSTASLAGDRLPMDGHHPQPEGSLADGLAAPVGSRIPVEPFDNEVNDQKRARIRPDW